MTVVSLRGELDVLDAPGLRACLRDIQWRARPRIVADLTGLGFIDCACLAVLAGLCRETRALGGSLALAGPHGSVLRILSVTGLLAGFEVHDTAAQAAGVPGRRRRTIPRPGHRRFTGGARDRRSAPATRMTGPASGRAANSDTRRHGHSDTGR